MACLGFHSGAEFNTYVTFVMLGMSILMVASAITSAPDFITHYYKYATGDEFAPCEKEFFWQNANTFYNVGTYVMQVITELCFLLPAMRRIPLRLRLFVGMIVPFFEMLLIIVVPAAKIPTQDGAIAVLMVVAVLGGFTKALCDSTTNALVGPFPTKFMNGAQWGLTVSALFMSIVQIILKGAMSNSFQDVLTQSRIYFAIGMFIQVVAVVEMAIMDRNPFAQKYVAEFRVKAMKRRQAAGEDSQVQEGEPHSGEPREPPTGLIQEDPAQENLDKQEAMGEELDEVRAINQAPAANAAVLKATGDADKMKDLDQTGNLTSGDQMVRVSIIPVFKKVWPMMMCAFLVYFTSLLIFPGVFFHVPVDDEWYTTLIVAFFNIGDFLSRVVLMVRQLRAPPKVVLAGTFIRLLIIPLLVVCARGLIKGVALPYVLILLLGLTNGYFGTMACIYCPRTPTLHLAGERSLAAMLSGVSLMLGLCFGSNFALLVNLTM